MDRDQLCINTVRCLVADMVQKANSGHPGAPLGMAPMAHVLWGKIMRYNPRNARWINRDRFILSNGHACGLLYSMLHLTGYDMSMEELQNFRQVGHITAGHPENELHPAIEVSTGPLGQGISNAVGLALAEKHLSAVYNAEGHEVFNNFVYVFAGDGCLQEGVSSEAGSLAGHLGLGRLIVLYDDNSITIDGPTSLSFSEDVLMRYEAYGWHTQSVADGNDLEGIEAAIRNAQLETDRPSIIKVTTKIGFGSEVEGTKEAHGQALGEENVEKLKQKFGFDPSRHFHVPDEVAAYYREAGERAAQAEEEWNRMFESYRATYPERAAEIERRFSRELPEGWMDILPRWRPGDKEDATRGLSQKVLNALAERIPDIMGGSADLTPSNKTDITCSGDFQRDTPANRYIRYGVREHGMAAISNGLAAYGGIIPYAGTFLNFIGYAAGAVRLSALSGLRVVYVATHDSIGLGEDGPTHQPIEMLLMLRGMPQMDVYRPADGNETSASYALALQRSHRPATLALSRQKVPHLAHSTIEKALRGGYIVFDSAEGAANGAASAGAGDGAAVPEGKPDMLIVATGSEVSLAMEAAQMLEGKRVWVASMPCLEVFDEQDLSYRKAVIPDGVPVVSVEASCSLGWERYSHAQVGLNRFGASGKGPDVYKYLGITPEAVADKARRLMERFPPGTAPIIPAVNDL